ncbi:MAG: YihY/virulence factor BrkB family protein [Pseudomonadota bacterium]
MSFEQLEHFKQRFDRFLWGTPASALPFWQAALLGALRILYVVIRDIAEGMLNLRAMSLVYTTLLSMVPLLAVSFSVLKGFGVHNQVEPMLLNLLAPLGEKGVEITTRIIEFVDNIQVGILGSVGLALLIFTVVSLMQKIESAFNYTWNVSQERSFARRFSNYMSVIIVGPVLIFSAIGLTATMMSHTLVQQIAGLPLIGTLLTEAQRLVPYLLIVAAFTFIYIFIPNTKVNLRSALVGAIISGAMWEATGWAFASFLVNTAKYTAIYSAFATLIFFIIWIYLGWLILLIGSSIAYYHQHPEARSKESRPQRLDNRGRERLTLLLLRLIGQRFYQKQPAWDSAGLARHSGLPEHLVSELLGELRQCGILCHTDENDPHYVPAVPFEDTRVAEVLRAIRQRGDFHLAGQEGTQDARVVARLMDTLDHAIESGFGDLSLKDLALADGPP